MKYHKGDVVTFLQPWREDEIPENPTGTGKVLKVHKRSGYEWLQIEGRERWIWSKRVTAVESAGVVPIGKVAA